MSGIFDKLTILEMKISRLLELLEKERIRAVALADENAKLRDTSAAVSVSQETLGSLEADSLMYKKQRDESEERAGRLRDELETLRIERNAGSQSDENALLKEQIADQKERYDRLVLELESMRSGRSEGKDSVEGLRKRIEFLLKELEDVPEDDDNGEPESEDGTVSEAGTGAEDDNEIGSESDETIGEDTPSPEEDDEWKDLDEIKEEPEGAELDEGGKDPQESELDNAPIEQSFPDAEEPDDSDNRGSVTENNDDLEHGNDEGASNPHDDVSKIELEEEEPLVKKRTVKKETANADSPYSARVMKRRIMPDAEADIPLFQLDANGNESDVPPSKQKAESKDDLI